MRLRVYLRLMIISIFREDYLAGFRSFLRLDTLYTLQNRNNEPEMKMSYQTLGDVKKLKKNLPLKSQRTYK